MSITIKIKKGLDVKLAGKAELVAGDAVNTTLVAVKPSDFPGVTPKLSVQTEDIVKAGTPLFYDKNNPEIKFTSPVSGKVKSINRGERRRILEVVVEADGKNSSESFPVVGSKSFERDAVKEALLSSGLWPFIVRRPFGVVAYPGETPRDIFVSGFDSAPLAPDYNFIFSEDKAAFQKGIDAISALTDGKVYLGVKEGSVFSDVIGVELVKVAGPHPAGNVGIQIHNVKPINKGEVVWTVSAQALVYIGRLFESGKLDLTKTIALTGSEVAAPKYYKTVQGAEISSIVAGKTKGAVSERIISGNVLTGTQVDADNFLGFYHNQVTVIPEGDEVENFGWVLPGFKKYSPNKTFLSNLFPKKEYVLNANFHGGERAFVVSEQYEKVVPMDILPVYLLKAILNNDFDKMEQLGLYEVIEEDLALCEYVCTSKIEVQQIVRTGINTMLKEL